MAYSAAIFDLDGTLLNTIDDLAASVNYALRKHDLPERTLPEVTKFVGNGIRRLVALSVPEGCDSALEASVFNDFRSYYAIHHLDNTAPYPHIPQLLKNLSKRGVLLAVVSNKSDSDVQVLIRHFFPNTFQVVVGEQEQKGIRRKPAPDTVLACMERLGLSRSQCVYIGDSEVDVLTAQNAGMDEIAVTWGFRSQEFVESYGAKVFANDCTQLEQLIVGPSNDRA